MCGRYVYQESTGRDIMRLAEGLDPQVRMDRYGDICPSEEAVILSGRGGSLYAENMRWGFPAARTKQLLINARAETALQKRSFSESVLYRRCIIPASAFYEWDHDKNKFTFTLEDSASVYMAGFYKLFEGGRRFVILTTQANESMKRVHDRMPLILSEKELADWIFADRKTEAFLGQEGPALKALQEAEERPKYEQLTLPFL